MLLDNMSADNLALLFTDLIHPDNRLTLAEKALAEYVMKAIQGKEEE